MHFDDRERGKIPAHCYSTFMEKVHFPKEKRAVYYKQIIIKGKYPSYTMYYLLITKKREVKWKNEGNLLDKKFPTLDRDGEEISL